MEIENENGIRALCLDPTDLAVSKLAAGREKDLAFVRVLLRERMIDGSVLSARADATSQLAEAERARLRERISAAMA